MCYHMVSRDDHRLVIWPQYFDRSLTRSQGRRVAKKYAVDKPSVDDIAKAAKSLHLHPVIEKNAIYSSQPWRKKGRVLIDAQDSKEKTLEQLASRL